MNTEINTETKTGAIVCVKTIPGTQDLEYRALLFITDIPLHITDDKLTGLLGGHIRTLSDNCYETLVRADINATSNEVSEQFNNAEIATQKVPYENFV